MANALVDDGGQQLVGEVLSQRVEHVGDDF